MMDAQKLFDRLNEIKSLYIEVKEAVILAENFDPYQESYLAPLNELTNSFDHIIRSLIYTSKFEYELREAKVHLYRAGYDAYEMLAMNIMAAITRNVERYDAQTIAAVFPTYYSEIKPTIVLIKVALADAREYEQMGEEADTKVFTLYKEKVSTLIRHFKTCNEQIPALHLERSKRRTRQWLKTTLGIVIGIIVTIAGTWIYDKYFRSDKKPVTVQLSR